MIGEGFNTVPPRGSCICPENGLTDLRLELLALSTAGTVTFKEAVSFWCPLFTCSLAVASAPDAALARVGLPLGLPPPADE